jgi:quercetin dioxygenase-like cupin family protein
MSTEYQRQSIPRPQAASDNALRTTLLENDEVLVIDNTYPPGASAPMHKHRFPSVVYVVEGGAVEAMAPDGTVETYDMRAGETLWSAAPHVHGTRNAGTPHRILAVEDTILQMSVIGPHTYVYMNAADDPRVLSESS